MAKEEGTIQFTYELRPGRRLGGLNTALQPLFAWRNKLRRLQLVGQTPELYGGLGYGNLSMRDPVEVQAFIVTASQTSGIETLTVDDLCQIYDFDLRSFRVRAEGTKPPSSESLTHAMIYAADSTVNWVFHVHSAEIWRLAHRLGLPTIPADVGYGSPAMANAVTALMRAHDERPLVFATLGHEDGVFACGAAAEETGDALIHCQCKICLRQVSCDK